MNLKKVLIKVFSANFLQTIVSVVVGFVVPSILTIEGYANLKTYTLYITYIGLFHFGFIDGLYIKYGGKNKDDINISILKGEHLFLIVSQLIITFLGVLIYIFSKDFLVLLLSISILPLNLLNFHKQFNQSIGEFNVFARILNIYSIFYIILNLLFVFVFKINNYIFYCIINILSNLFAMVYSEILYKKYTKNNKLEIKKDDIKKTINCGFFIMIGNLIAILLYAIDKWFIKLFFTTIDFSYYSFAISMFNIVIILLNSISITFYNVFAKNKNDSYVKKIKNNVLLIGSYSSSIYFILVFIINSFLKKYIPSLTIISLTFSTFPYLFIIKAIYVNLYKTRNLEKKYTKVVIGILIISIILNTISMFINKSTTYIAVATLLTFVIWYFYSIRDFKFLKISKFETCYLLIITFSFIYLTHNFNYIISFVLYNLVVTISSYILLKTNIFKIIKK